MTQAPDALLAGALDNLMRYLLTGCGHSARRAAILLDRLATEPGTDAELQCACQRMCEQLNEQGAPTRIPPASSTCGRAGRPQPSGVFHMRASGPAAAPQGALAHLGPA